MLGALLPARPLLAQNQVSASLETGVKAAYLYRFLAYAEWPPERFDRPDSPYVIGVLANDELFAELTKMVAGRHVNARSVRTRKLREGESLAGVHVLYVGSEPLPAAALTMPGLLTVTQSESAVQRGVINLRLIDGRVRFEVSMPAAERNQLRLSSRMLAIAAAVHTGGG